ncbi:MAG: hypothetical protein GC192_16685 [Bacteroidetes bacterium]|nr:hypothetical protein [Bacteroidota bacterium]
MTKRDAQAHFSNGWDNQVVENGCIGKGRAEKQGQRGSETEPCAVERRRCACCEAAAAAWAARQGGWQDWLRQPLGLRWVSVFHTDALGGVSLADRAGWLKAVAASPEARR